MNQPTPTPGATRAADKICHTISGPNEWGAGDLAAIITEETGVAELLQMLDEARLQLEYLDAKFPSTGTTASVLTKLEALLAAHKQHRPNADKP